MASTTNSVNYDTLSVHDKCYISNE